MLQPLLRQYHLHWMARFTFWVIVSSMVLGLFERLTGHVPGILWFLLGSGLVIAAAYYLIRLFSFVRYQMLWRLSRRLAVTYVFIAFVPVILILSLVLIAAMIISGQFAAFLVRVRLFNHFDELRQLNRVVAHEAQHTKARTPQGLFDELQTFYSHDLSQYTASYPGLEITLRAGSESRAFLLDGDTLDHVIPMPAWLTQEEWAGVVVDPKRIALRAVDRAQTPAGQLTLILSVPVTPALLNMVGAGIGPVGVVSLPETGKIALESLKGGAETAGGSAHLFPPSLSQAIIRSSAVDLPKPLAPFDVSVTGASAIHPVEWGAAKFQQQTAPVLVAVRSRILTPNQQLLRMLGGLSSAPVVAFITIGVGFLVIEVIALLIGIILTRSITSTVNRLQVATERVKSGDFSHRIGLPARDQVSALGEAFDTMTASVERLLVESREKSRLESELKIAREVQTQLFPQSAPEVAGVKMFGVCQPAREVSGDYYDFLRLGQDHLGLVLGDVSGKGIVAALLMASIQSAIHAQFYDGHLPGSIPAAAVPISPVEVVERLNRQLYENTPAEKYATFFYAVYNTQSRVLTYTNAGHPPPFLFRHESLMRLQTGGTVLGLFPTVQFEQSQVGLQPGDLVLAFTDGMTEPENSYGEEFGEDRLAEAVRQDLDSPPDVLAERIYRTVIDWTGSAEPQDDMTMLYLKAVHD